MKHASLFSGIGGFDLAALWVGIETLVQVENDEWCLRVLEKNFPNAKRFADIRRFNGKPFRGKIDILTGGFPCQPFSVAGKRGGKKDLRFLWPQMLRVIKEIRPRFVVAENVPGIISMALDKVLADLEAIGYTAETFVIPALAQDAPHRRDRVWIVAYSNSFRAQIPHQRRKPTKQISFSNCSSRSSSCKPAGWSIKPRVGRVADGIPGRLDRIKGLGNAIVPQVAEQIFRLLIRFDEKEKPQLLNGVKDYNMARQHLSEQHAAFVELVITDLTSHSVRTSDYYRSKAGEFEITDDVLTKDLCELALAICSRKIARQEKTYSQRYEELVALHYLCGKLPFFTTQSALLFQHGTPVPIAFLCGIIAGADVYKAIFEPAAGNGLLTIAAEPRHIIANEIDETLRRHLKAQGFYHVLNQDASFPFTFKQNFSTVLANPPGGRIKDVRINGYSFQMLDHLICVQALEKLSKYGRAALIIQGHPKHDDKGRLSKSPYRVFMDYLYTHFYVADVIPIDGKLCEQTGSGADLTLIIIALRRPRTDSAALSLHPKRQKPIKTFEELFARVMGIRKFIFPPEYLTPDEYIFREQAENSGIKLDVYKLREQHRDIVKTAKEQGVAFPYDVKRVYPNIFQEVKPEPNESEIERAAEDIFSMLDDSGISVSKESDTEESSAPVPTADPANSDSKKGFDEAVVIHDFLHRNSRALNYKITYSLDTPGNAIFIFYKAFPDDYHARRWADSYLRHELHKHFGNRILLESIETLDHPQFLNGLSGPYIPTSQGCIVLDTVVPDAMDFETHEALKKVREAIGGDIDEFVRNRLGYGTKVELCAALAAEQIDAVALAIYNIEAREQGMIEGDQTGIGKGRVAAAMIRYAVKHGYKPIFLTEKPNLFSDLYRDLKAIGSGSLRPLIVNAKDDKTDILDEDGEVLYEALTQKQQSAVFETGDVPDAFHFLLATYSQFSSQDLSLKQRFLRAVAHKNILIMDEAHNASGEGNTGFFMQQVIGRSKGVLYLSATYAKKPANLPLYARKTFMRESNMSREQLVWAIKAGGVALQEVISAELVKEAQMLRRERSFEGVEVNYISLDEMESEHTAIADTVTEVLRDTIRFQEEFVRKEINRLDNELAESNVNVEMRKGTKQAGVSNDPYFSRVFNVINQMLFSIKAEAVAERAIARLKERKKPVIAFSSTMASFIESLTNEDGEPVKVGDVISADFAEVLKRGLDSVMRYTVTLPNGRVEQRTFAAKDLGPQAELAFWNIIEKIETVSTGISISPIDVIIQRIRAAGFSVAEVTGRKFEIELNEVKTDSGIDFSSNDEDEFPEIDLTKAFGQRTKIMGQIRTRKRVLTNEAFRMFNNNQIDVLLINQAGSTGASAHAIVTDKVPLNEVKQRVMIVLQPELDINTEVQKRGRINRTGQVYKPIYDYVSSAIPAEKRLMMMLQRKLKSLDANTTSNQKQSTRILDVPDFLNKYGDLVVTEYLMDHPELNETLQDPLGIADKETDENRKEIKRGQYDAAFSVSGRVAVLSTKDQQEFYDEVIRRYNDHVEFVKQTGEYDLEVEEMKLAAETKKRQVLIMGRGGSSSFGKDSVLETVEVNVLRKPLKPEELENMLRQSLDGLSPNEHSKLLHEEFRIASERMLSEELLQTKEIYSRAIEELKTSPNLKKLLEKHGWEAYDEAMSNAERKLKEERTSREEKAQFAHERRNDFAKSILSFFYVGRVLYYPTRTLDEGQINIPAIFLGFTIDRKQKNPFAPSAIKLRFAIASGLRYLVVPASKTETIQRIKGESFDLPHRALEQIIPLWDAAVRKRISNRETRYIITGNILQALGRFRGKLINYTTSEGAVVKGILMPEYWEPEKEKEKGVAVPATKAYNLLRELAEGGHMVIGKHLSLFRRQGRFMVIVSGTRSKGGEVFLNENLLALLDGGSFRNESDKMVAYFESDKLRDVLNILEDELGTSVSVTPTQFEKIYEEYMHQMEKKSFPELELLPEVIEDEIDELRERELELEAEAILLLLELED